MRVLVRGRGRGGGGERVCGGSGGWGELAAELGDGSEDGLLGGVGGDAEGFGDGLDGLVFHVAEDEGGALHGGEGEHGALAAAEGFGLEDGGFGGEAGGDGDVFGGGAGLDGDGVPGDVAGAAFDEVEGAVHGDAVDPGAEGGVLAEAGEFFVGEEEGFLGCLLGVDGAAGDAVGHAKNGGEMTVHEHAKGVSIAGEDAPDRVLLRIAHSRG